MLSRKSPTTLQTVAGRCQIRVNASRSDQQQRFVSCLLFTEVPAVECQALLGCTCFERKPLNHAKVAQQVMAAINLLSLRIKIIIGYCTDNARFMLKS